MSETMNRCEDSCIEAGNIEKALYYKWLRIDSDQRNLEFLEQARIG
jgi:hypothetical protein